MGQMGPSKCQTDFGGLECGSRVHLSSGEMEWKMLGLTTAQTSPSCRVGQGRVPVYWKGSNQLELVSQKEREVRGIASHC